MRGAKTKDEGLPRAGRPAEGGSVYRLYGDAGRIMRTTREIKRRLRLLGRTPRVVQRLLTDAFAGRGLKFTQRELRAARGTRAGAIYIECRSGPLEKALATLRAMQSKAGGSHG